jgi:predicted DNA-binding transcriptional regulator AlpA
MQTTSAKKGYTVKEWCAAYGICPATFYNLQKRGEGPRIKKVGSRSIVTDDADAEWRRRDRHAGEGA